MKLKRISDPTRGQPPVRRLGLALGLALGVSLAVSPGCDKPEEAALYGRWQNVQTSEVLEFKDDGTVLQADSGGPMFGGTFRYVSPDRIRVSFGGPSDIAPPKTFGVELEGDSLAVTDENGKTQRYRRRDD